MHYWKRETDSAGQKEKGKKKRILMVERFTYSGKKGGNLMVSTREWKGGPRRGAESP